MEKRSSLIKFSDFYKQLKNKKSLTQPKQSNKPVKISESRIDLEDDLSITDSVVAISLADDTKSERLKTFNDFIGEISQIRNTNLILSAISIQSIS